MCKLRHAKISILWLFLHKFCTVLNFGGVNGSPIIKALVLNSIIRYLSFIMSILYTFYMCKLWHAKATVLWHMLYKCFFCSQSWDIKCSKIIKALAESQIQQ